MNNAILFEAYEFAKGMRLRNRMVMAPMTTWSANADGTVSEEEEYYFRRRSHEVGLVITGCSHVTADGIGFTDEFAAYDDRFTPGLKRLAMAAKSGGAPAILQLFHAGNRAVADLIPGGEVVSASGIPTNADSFNPATTPRALFETEILEIVDAFGRATRRAIEAGFDGVELHGAHGFLIQNFFSPHFNTRKDSWGGDAERRMRFPLAVVNAVKEAIDQFADRAFLLGFRISPEERFADGLRIDDFKPLIENLISTGIDYLHVSQPAGLLQTKPLAGSDGSTIAEQIMTEVGGLIPVIGAGQLRTPQQAEQAINLGLSLVALGQSLIINPDWVSLAREGRHGEIETSIDAAKAREVDIPRKLWAVIEATPGWFDIRSSD